MAVAAPRRRTVPAPPPSRTTPPKRKAPARKPASKSPSARAAAPARKAPARKAPARKAPARRSPQRATSRFQAGGQLIPLAVGRTAVAVTQLPDSGLVVRMTRGRTWIAVLGVLLVGIVGLNVVTLSFAASSGKIDEQIGTLEKENSMLANREALKYGTGRVRAEGAEIGLIMPNAEEPTLVKVSPDDVATAAQRLAAAGG